MVIADMIHSCSNDKVAQAAVASIGGSFADRVRVAAQGHGLNVGRFVAAVVRNFARHANGEAREALQRESSKADQPLLHGLRRVVERALENDASFFDDELCGAFPRVGGAAGFSGYTRCQ
jgi:hypothetical protein